MNVQFLIASIIALAGVILHVYTMEVLIWPHLKEEGFPDTPFGNSRVVKGFYRLVWHFFTVAWIFTIVGMAIFSFASLILYVNLVVLLMILYWTAITICIFIVTALSLEPGQSYVKTMIKGFQWVIIVIMIVFMYWGTTLS